MPEPNTSLSFSPPAKPSAPAGEQGAPSSVTPPVAVAPAPAGQAPPAPVDHAKQLEAERAARAAAEQKAAAAEQSYANLRTVVDRQGSVLSQIQQRLRAQQAAGQINAPGEGEEGAASAPPSSAGGYRADDPDTQLLRFEMAQTRFFTRDASASARQDEILNILRDPTQASRYAAYTPVEQPDGSVSFRLDYEGSIRRVWDDLQLRDFRKQQADAATPPQTAGTRTQGASIGASASSVEPASPAQGDEIARKMKSGEISPEDGLRQLYALGLVEVDLNDLPEALGKPLTPPRPQMQPQGITR